MSNLLRFPAPPTVADYAREIEDALDPLRAICFEAARRPTVTQKVELAGRVTIMSTMATAALTDSISLEEQAEAVEGLIRGMERKT